MIIKGIKANNWKLGGQHIVLVINNDNRYKMVMVMRTYGNGAENEFYMSAHKCIYIYI